MVEEEQMSQFYTEQVCLHWLPERMYPEIQKAQVEDEL